MTDESKALVVVETAPARYRVPKRAERLFMLAVGTLSAATRQAYAEDLRTFARWWDKADGASALRDLCALDLFQARETVLEYQLALIERGNSKATVARRIRSLNSIVKKLCFAGKARWELNIPVDRVRTYKDTAGPAPKTWEKLLSVTSADESPIGLRDTAILYLLRNNALRASEVCSIKYPSGVDMHEHRVRVLRKGGEWSWVFCAELAWEAVLRWKEERGTFRGALFCSMRRKLPLDRKVVWSVVKKRSATAGVPAVWPHALRHSGITAVLDATKDVKAAQDFAGHQQGSTTLRYVDNLDDRAKQAAEAIGSRKDEDDE